MEASEEVWKPVVGYEVLYDVSNIGSVRRSLTAPSGKNNRPGRMLSPDISTGYARVYLHREGKIHRELVHRLVAKTFLGGVPRQHVNHIDGNKLNNKVANLEWVTQRENVQHAWRTGLCHPIAGEDHGGAKLTDRDIIVIRDAAARGVPQRMLANIFRVTESAISSIVCLKSWTHVKPEKSA